MSGTDVSPPYVLGIDAGTEAVKAGLFDLQGNLVASGVGGYAPHFPKPGWAEQAPNDWWLRLFVLVASISLHMPCDII
jgi:sugar (pentulose or hexulose) kinase